MASEVIIINENKLTAFYQHNKKDASRKPKKSGGPHPLPAQGC
jgi:hypothetical protein